MTENLSSMIEDVLRKTLGPYGFDHVEIREDVDHADEPALFIDAWLKPNAPFISGKVSSKAHGALSDALLKQGERRFPYLFIRHPDDEHAEP